MTIHLNSFINERRRRRPYIKIFITPFTPLPAFGILIFDIVPATIAVHPRMSPFAGDDTGPKASMAGFHLGMAASVKFFQRGVSAVPDDSLVIAHDGC